MIFTYKNQLKFLNDLYVDLNSNFSYAYLTGSNWYIGNSLINNSYFFYPPGDFFFCNHNLLDKSNFILKILGLHYEKITVKNNLNYFYFLISYDINFNLKQNIFKFKKKKYIFPNYLK